MASELSKELKAIQPEKKLFHNSFKDMTHYNKLRDRWLSKTAKRRNSRGRNSNDNASN